MAKIFFDAVDGSVTVSNSNAFVFGYLGTTSVTVEPGAAGIVIDQNSKKVVFTGASSSYTFAQAGNHIKVYDGAGATLLATIAVQGDADGTALTFSNGTAQAIIGGTGAMRLGGATVGASAAVVTPTTLDQTTVAPGAGTSTSLVPVNVFLEASDGFNVNNNNATVHGSGGTESVSLKAGQTGLVLDQNVETVVLAAASSSYTFAQAGNQLKVYDSAGFTLLATIPVQGDADGTAVTFLNGTQQAILGIDGVMRLGGATIGATPAAVTPPVVPGPTDTTAPVFAGATVNGGTLVMSYTEASTLDAAQAPASGAFAVVAGGAANAVTAVAVDAAAKTVTLTLATAVSNGAAVTVGYTDPSAGNDANAIQDAAGNDATTISPQAVTNNTNNTNATALQFVLTTANDVKLGGAGDDTFIGLFSNGGAGSNTFNIGDTLTGNGGADTLLINNQSAGAAISLDDTFWTGTSTIENVVIAETGAGVQTFITSNNFNMAFSAGVHLTAKSTGGAIGFTMGGAVAETATLTTTSTGGIQTIDTGSGTGAVTVEATSTGGGLNVTGADLVSVTTNSTAGIQTILSTGTRAVTVNATSTTGAQTITTGAGNDTIVVHSTAGETINAGGGKDAITLDASHVAVQAVAISAGDSTQAAFDTITNFGIMTGAGSDTLALGSTTLLTAAQLGAGWINGAGVATKAGATLADFLLAATTNIIAGVAAYSDGSNTYVVASDGLVSGAADTVVQLVGVNTATAVANAVAATTIHIV